MLFDFVGYRNSYFVYRPDTYTIACHNDLFLWNKYKDKIHYSSNAGMFKCQSSKEKYRNRYIQIYMIKRSNLIKILLYTVASTT